MDESHTPKNFDPRTEVSAGEKHIANQIVMHLWIIFVVIPIVLTIIYMVFKPNI